MTRANLLLVSVLSLALALGAWGLGSLGGGKEDQGQPTSPEVVIIAGSLPKGALVGGAENLQAVDWGQAEATFHRIFDQIIPDEKERDGNWEKAKEFTKTSGQGSTRAVKEFFNGLVPPRQQADEIFAKLGNPVANFGVEKSPDDFKTLLDPRDDDDFIATIDGEPVGFVGMAKEKCWFAKNEIPAKKGEPVTAKIEGVGEVSCQRPTVNQWKSALDKDPDGTILKDLKSGNGEHLREAGMVAGRSDFSEESKKAKWDEACEIGSRMAQTKLKVEPVRVTDTEVDRVYKLKRDAGDLPSSGTAGLGVGAVGSVKAKIKSDLEAQAKKAAEDKANNSRELFSYRWVIESPITIVFEPPSP